VFFGVVLVAATSLMLLRANDPITCESQVAVKITAVPAIAAAIDDITKRDVDTGCAQIRVVAQSADDAARDIADGGTDLPALWIPDSTIWPDRAEQLAAVSSIDPPLVRSAPPLVSSPLVLVTSRMHGSRLGWPDAPIGWKDLVTGSVSGLATTIGDPLSTTEGLTTLTAVRGLLGDQGATPRPETLGAMLRVGRNAAPSIQSAYDRLSSSGQAVAFTATEQSVIAHNRGTANTPVVAVYPRDGTVTLEYPLVRVVAPSEAAGVGEIANRVEQALRTPAATASLLATGFRSPDGSLDQGLNAALGVTASKPALLAPPSVEQVTEMLRTWSAVTLDSRTLVVIDVSGSMTASAGNGQSRIELARDASLAALGLFPDGTEIGLWAFSTAKAPPNGWVELVPIGPMTDPLAGGSRRQAASAAIRSLPTHIGGGTALNETALAATRTVRASYQPRKVNSVVLLTDGRNEEPGINTATLVRILKEEIDPERPVPIIAIGIGPDVDFDALRQITATTSGKAYLAKEPADMGGVFLDALIQRQCRPNC
jgi:Ca-activated chloride channel family protein